MNYTTSDFTDIRGPEEKPTVPGWYASYVTILLSRKERMVAFQDGTSGMVCAGKDALTNPDIGSA